jgi:uncharacterized circularly permuted ATP-grasp superfamily protein/uncharacterized alpha-E superfamily protein
LTLRRKLENSLCVTPTRVQPAGKVPGARWNEVYSEDGALRPAYGHLLRHIEEFRPRELRALNDRVEATLREMGVAFGRSDQQRPWVCDLLPHVFTEDEWQRIARGFEQRLRAFEMFLRDVYGAREILRRGVIPVQPILGSPFYQRASIGLPRPQDAYLHLSGICVTRDGSGALLVKRHHFSHAPGISYMMQNRRALARVIPEIFHDAAVQSIADVPLAISEKLRSVTGRRPSELSVVLLTPGVGNAVYSEHGFLARRMGIPLVQGNDLLVLDERVHLKTVHGLQPVDVIYTCVYDTWLDPLVFRPDSLLGVPGLVHCLRKGAVTVLNGIGSQLADDRALLCFDAKIIRFYLGEEPVLPSVPTRWLGDIDQRELVLENADAFEIKSVLTAGIWDAPASGEELARQLRKHASRLVAQPLNGAAKTIRIKNGRAVEARQDHIVFAVRRGDGFEVFPGALTIIAGGGPENDAAWLSKDTWVPSETAGPATANEPARPFSETHLSARQVTSRVAEAFYWMGRYLERAYHQAYLIQAIETFETEELNSAERKLYRPMWNRLLPPIEKSAGESRRSITNRLDRYRLVLLPEPGSVVRTFQRAMSNAESIQESISPEAWAALSNLRLRFQRTKYREKITETQCTSIARRLSESATQIIPQFFATASATMLADDGWRFCEIGQRVERAIITANAIHSTSEFFMRGADAHHATEIELSAFLRLLGTRDVYRRVYQVRAEPVAVLELLWQNPQAPRSILRCLQRCITLLRESLPTDTPETASTVSAMDGLIQHVKGIDWKLYVRPLGDDASTDGASASPAPQAQDLEPLLHGLLAATQEVHNLISDAFLSHQARIAESVSEGRRRVED